MHCAFGIEIKEAAQIIAAWTEEPVFNRSTFKFNPLSEDTLLAYWKDAVKDQWLRDLRRERLNDESAKRDLLAKYPRHTWQHTEKLKPYM